MVSTIKMCIGSNIVSEFTSTGQKTSALTINNKVNLLTNTNTLLTTATTLTYPLNEFYSIIPSSTAFTITLP